MPAREEPNNVAEPFIKRCKYCACTSQGYHGESSLRISQLLLLSLRFLCSKLSPCINIAIVQAEFSCAILRLKVRCQVRMADGCRGVRSRHIIPVPTDHIMKVAASHLSLSQPLDLSPLAPLLSANHSPSTLGSIPLGPIPLSLSARFLSVVCALPER